MDLVAYSRLKAYILGLGERELWALLVEYFQYLGVRADIVHSTGEHGMDVIAHYGPDQDPLGIGCNIVIQAKAGRLGLKRWRKEVLYQLLELPYYTIEQSNYPEDVARRVLLVVTGDETVEVRRSIRQYNKKHDIVIDLWDANDLIRQFGRSGFARAKLEQITGVGELEEPSIPSPPAVGDPDGEVYAPDAAR